MVEAGPLSISQYIRSSTHAARFLAGHGTLLFICLLHRAISALKRQANHILATRPLHSITNYI